MLRFVVSSLRRKRSWQNTWKTHRNSWPTLRSCSQKMIQKDISLAIRWDDEVLLCTCRINANKIFFCRIPGLISTCTIFWRWSKELWKPQGTISVMNLTQRSPASLPGSKRFPASLHGSKRGRKSIINHHHHDVEAGGTIGGIIARKWVDQH
jgi:hypothetical protein